MEFLGLRSLFLFFTSVSATFESHGFITSGNIREKVFFRLYNGVSSTDHVNISFLYPVELLKHKYFDLKRPTVFYISGYSPYGGPVLSENYMGSSEYNNIHIDWRALSGRLYFTNAVPNALRFAKILPEVLKELINGGLNRSSIIVIGVSLGAHVAGHTGFNIQKLNTTLPRIIGVDPAFPGFYIFRKRALRSGDAEFVYCLHTDAGGYGTPFGICDADFWANGGKRIQSGCSEKSIALISDPCSHIRSVYYWVETITNNKAFIGLKCDSYKTFKEGGCASNPTVEMSFNTPNTTRGNYYFMTNANSPFGKGLAGTKYEP